MVEGKKKSRFRRSSFSWYDPTDWGYKPSTEFRFTVKMIPLVIVMILGFSLGLSNPMSFASGGRQIIDDRAGDYKSKLRDAYSMIVSRDYTQAAVLAGEVAKIDPENVLAHHILGLAHARRGLTEEASASLNRAVELDPEFTMAWYNLGVVEESRGEFVLAMEAYLAAKELEPDNEIYSKAYDSMNEIVLNGSNWDYRETEFERIFLLAVSAANRGGEEDLGFAENIFRMLLLDRPYDVASMNMLGFTLAREGRHDDAEEVLIRVVEIEPGYPDAWFNLGMLHESMGRFEEALVDFETAHHTSSLGSFRERAMVEADRVRELLISETIITPSGYNNNQ